MGHLLDVLATHVPAPRVLGGADAPFSMLVSQMDGTSTFMGKLVLGRCVFRRVLGGAGANCALVGGACRRHGACLTTVISVLLCAPASARYRAYAYPHRP